MPLRLNSFALAAFAVVFCALPVVAQEFSLSGVVKGPDGKPVTGAVISFAMVESRRHADVKSDKKGHYVLMLQEQGVYNVTITVDGQVAAKMTNMRIPVAGINTINTNEPLDFNLKSLGGATAAAPASAVAPQQNVSSAPVQKLSKEEQDKADKAAKEREAQLSKNKELNDTFAAGRAALDSKRWDEAAMQLTKASELGPTQPAVWAALAGALLGSANAAKGPDAPALFEKTFAAYQKLLELNPNDAATLNNYALALAAGKRLDDARMKLAKAVELDPPNAGMYHYNLGVLLMNSNQPDGAVDEFRKTIGADPNHAEAYYYYGSTLAGKATLDQASGKMVVPPGTVEALQKYLALKADGPNAESAKALIAALGSSVAVNYKDPKAPAPKAPAKTGK